MLHDRRILVTRAVHQASTLADELRNYGADVVLIPTIAIEPLEDYKALDHAIKRITFYDWLLFTSSNAVEAFSARLEELHRPPPRTIQTAVIGESTGRAAHHAGLTVDLQPPQAVAESLAEALLPYAADARMLLVRAEQARDHLPETLRAAGARIDIAPAYRTTIPADSVDALRALLQEGKLDAITLTSSSAARNLFDLIEASGEKLPKETVLASIGPVTTATLRELGYVPQVEAAEATTAGLAKALADYFK